MYRFFDNQDVTLAKLLEPHREPTLQRAAAQAVQDTTTLNYSAHPATAGTGPIGTRTSAVVAVRIMHLTWLGRTHPKLPCTVYFEDNQWKALSCFLTRTPTPQRQVPTISEVVGWVGKLGGQLGRQCDGPPGTQVLWEGIQHTDDIVAGRLHERRRRSARRPRRRRPGSRRRQARHARRLRGAPGGVVRRLSAGKRLTAAGSRQ